MFGQVFTWRRKRRSDCPSRAVHMAGRGTGSVLCSTMLKWHFLRWSDMLGRSVKPHDNTGLKAVLNLHTLFLICHDTVPGAPGHCLRSHCSSTMPLVWRRLAHTSLIVRDTSDSWHRLKLSRNPVMCHSISMGSPLIWSDCKSLGRFPLGQG